MTEARPGQIWRNTHGAYVRVEGYGPCFYDGRDVGALWVQVCDEQGAATGDRVPMEPGPHGFPGPLWTLCGDA